MKENKFLTGFLIVTLLGAGVLGFFLFQAKGKYSEAFDAYTTKVGELQTLQNGKPYPDEANYKKMLELQKAHQQAINDLQKQLAAAEFPVEPLTPEKFQDNLRESVKRVIALAAQKGTKLPDKFYMGFDPYQAAPPHPVAAAPLGRMLKAMEKAVTELLNTLPTEIRAIKRDNLPEEGVPGKGPQPAASKPGTKKSDKAADEKPLVRRFPFEIEFVAHEPKFRTFMNAIVSSKEQFYIPAGVVLANEQQNGPSKASAEPTSPPPPPEDPNKKPSDPNTPPPPPPPTEATKFIVGEEKLQVLVRLEVVDFAEPAPDKTAEKAKKPAK